MIVVLSLNSVPIRLTQERWRHILRRHPELQSQKEKVLETLSSPDAVHLGDFDTLLAAKHCSRTPLTEKFLVVVYKELGRADGFILTAYFTTELSRRRQTLWKP